jgi:hypothetical protein
MANNISKPTKRDRILTAYHEAGHAVIGAVYGFHPDKVTIEGTETYKGGCFGKALSFALTCPSELVRLMIKEFAGIAAQDRYTHRNIAWLMGGNEDILTFATHWRMLADLTSGKCATQVKFESITRQAVKHYWYAVDLFAQELLERGTIENDGLCKLLDEIIYTDSYRYCPIPPDLYALNPNGDDIITKVTTQEG